MNDPHKTITNDASIAKRLRACLSLLQTCTGVDMDTVRFPSNSSTSSFGRTQKTTMTKETQEEMEMDKTKREVSQRNNKPDSLLTILMNYTESILQEYRQGLDIRLVHEIVNQTYIRYYSDTICGLSSLQPPNTSTPLDTIPRSSFPTNIGLVGWIERDIRNIHYNPNIPSLIFHDGQVRIPLIGTVAVHPRYLNSIVFIRHWSIHPLPSALTLVPQHVSSHSNNTVIANNYYIEADSIIPLLTIYDLLSLMIQHNYLLPVNISSTTRSSLIGTILSISRVFLLKKPDIYGFAVEVLIRDHFIKSRSQEDTTLSLSSSSSSSSSSIEPKEVDCAKVIILFEGFSFYHLHDILQVHEVYLFTYLAKRTIHVGDNVLSMYIAQTDNTLQTIRTISSLSTYPSTSIRTAVADYNHDTTLLQRLIESGTRILSPIFDKPIMNALFTNHSLYINNNLVPYSPTISTLHSPTVSLQGKILCITESSIILCHDYYSSTNVPPSTYMFSQIFLRHGPWISPSYIPSHPQVHEKFPNLIIPLSVFIKPGTVIRIHNVYPVDKYSSYIHNNDSKHNKASRNFLSSSSSSSSSLFHRTYCFGQHSSIHIHSIATERIDIDNFGLITVCPELRNPMSTVSSSVLYPYPLPLLSHICLRYSTKVIAGSWGEQQSNSSLMYHPRSNNQHLSTTTLSSNGTVTWYSIANEVFKTVYLSRSSDESVTQVLQHPLLEFLNHPSSSVHCGDSSLTASLPLLVVTPTCIGSVSLSVAFTLRNLLQEFSSLKYSVQQPWNGLYENDTVQRMHYLEQTEKIIQETLYYSFQRKEGKANECTLPKGNDIKTVYSQDMVSIMLPSYYFVPVAFDEAVSSTQIHPTLVGQLQDTSSVVGETELSDANISLPIVFNPDNDYPKNQLFIQSCPFRVRIDIIRVPYLITKPNEGSTAQTIDNHVSRNIQEFSIFSSLPCTSIDEYLHDCPPNIFQYYGERCRIYCKPGWNTVPIERNDPVTNGTSVPTGSTDKAGVTWIYRYRTRIEVMDKIVINSRPTFTSIARVEKNNVIIVPVTAPRVRMYSGNQFKITLECYIPSLHKESMHDLSKSILVCSIVCNQTLPQGFHLLSSIGYPLQLVGGTLSVDTHGRVTVQMVRFCQFVTDKISFPELADLSFLKRIPVNVSSGTPYLRTLLTVRGCLHSIGEVFTGDEPSSFWKGISLKTLQPRPNDDTSTDNSSPVYSNPPLFSLMGRILAIKVDPPEEKSSQNYYSNVNFTPTDNSPDTNTFGSSWIGWGKSDVKLTILLGHVSYTLPYTSEDNNVLQSMRASMYDTISVYFRPQNGENGILLPSDFSAGSVVVFTDVQRVYGRSHRIYCKCDNGSIVILRNYEQYQRLQSLYTIIDPVTARIDCTVPKFPLYQLLSDSCTNRSLIQCRGHIKKVLWFSCQWICPYTGTLLVPVPRGIIDTILAPTNPTDNPKLCLYSIGNHYMVRKHDAFRIQERVSSTTNLTKNKPINSEVSNPLFSSTEYTLPHVLLPSGDSSPKTVSSTTTVDRVTVLPGGSLVNNSVPTQGYTIPQYVQSYKKSSTDIQNIFPIEIFNESVFKIETSFLLDDSTGEIKAHMGDTYPYTDAKQYLYIVPSLGMTATILDFTGRQLQHWQQTTSLFGKLEINTQVSSFQFRQQERGNMHGYSDGEDDKYYGGLPYLLGKGKKTNQSAPETNRKKDGPKDELYDPFEETKHDDMLYWRNIKRKRLTEQQKNRTNVDEETTFMPTSFFGDENSLVIAVNHTIDETKHKRYEETFRERTINRPKVPIKSSHKSSVSTQLVARSNVHRPQGIDKETKNVSTIGKSRSSTDILPLHLQIQYFTAIEAATKLRQVILSRSNRKVQTYEFTCQLVYPAEFQPKTTVGTHDDEYSSTVTNNVTNISKFSRELQWRRDSTIRTYAPQLANIYVSLLQEGNAFLQSVDPTTASVLPSSNGKRKEPSVLLPSVPTTLPIPPPPSLLRTINIGKDDFQSKAVPKVHVRIVSLTSVTESSDNIPMSL